MNVISHLEVVNIASKKRQTLCNIEGLYEAPNWSPDGHYFVLNHNGHLYKFERSNLIPSRIDTGFATRCNNDHGISPDGSLLVISHHHQDHGESAIYCLPSEGGSPTLISQDHPSYWHGWSPDGSTIAYVASRGEQGYKIYSIAVDGGEETQLTFGAGHYDGPDYSADGKTLFFNHFENRMQIWRMESNGNHPQQAVFSEHSDWFPHPSPDGQYVVFLRYLQDQGEAHPFGQDVQLCLLDLSTYHVESLTDVFYGGQGTLNVPSWSPDSSEVAFVSYTPK